MILVLLITAWIVHRYPPHTNPFYPKCFFRKITTLECPGCGSARSLYSLVHGDLMQAADYNILLLLMLPVLLIGFIATVTDHFHETWRKLNKPLIYLLLILIFWILRNINYYPFTVLHSDK